MGIVLISNQLLNRASDTPRRCDVPPSHRRGPSLPVSMIRLSALTGFAVAVIHIVLSLANTSTHEKIPPEKSATSRSFRVGNSGCQMEIDGTTVQLKLGQAVQAGNGWRNCGFPGRQGQGEGAPHPHPDPPLCRSAKRIPRQARPRRGSTHPHPDPPLEGEGVGASAPGREPPGPARVKLRAGHGRVTCR